MMASVTKTITPTASPSSPKASSSTGKARFPAFGDTGAQHERAPHGPVVSERKAGNDADYDGERRPNKNRCHNPDGRRGGYALLHQRGEDERGSEEVETYLAEGGDGRLPPALKRRGDDSHQEDRHNDVDKDIQHV